MIFAGTPAAIENGGSDFINNGFCFMASAFHYLTRIGRIFVNAHEISSSNSELCNPRAKMAAVYRKLTARRPFCQPPVARLRAGRNAMNRVSAFSPAPNNPVSGIHVAVSATTAGSLPRSTSLS